MIDSTGTDHLHGGEPAMLDGLVGRLAMSGVVTRAAVADTWGAAHALARQGGQQAVLTAVGHGPTPIAPWPLEALRLPRPIAGGLRTLGFERIGDRLVQPRAPLALRFGPELGRRIDQASSCLICGCGGRSSWIFHSGCRTSAGAPAPCRA